MVRALDRPAEAEVRVRGPTHVLPAGRYYGKVVDGYPMIFEAETGAALASEKPATREAIASQGISTFLRELYKCGGSIFFGFTERGTGRGTLPEGVEPEEMVERLKAVASAEVAAL